VAAGRGRLSAREDHVNPITETVEMFENPFAERSYLVVDDFSDMRSVIKAMLRTLGAVQIDAARHGREAIEVLERGRYDVILCDYNLGPGKNGQQILEEARQRRLIGFDTVFVMVTAENTREMVMAAAEYEPDSYLSKPFTKELLRTRLEKLLTAKSDLASVNEALAVNDIDAAIAQLDRRIGARPRNLADLVYLKANICLENGRYETALGIYESILGRRDVAWARLGLGKVQYLQNHLVDASETFQQLIAANPNLTAAYDWLAKSQQSLGLADEAQQTLAKAVQLSPMAIQRQRRLGELASHNGDHAQAARSFEAAAELGTHSVYNHPAIFAGLARACAATGRHAEANAALTRIGDEFDGETARFYAATAESDVRGSQGDTDGAARCLIEAAQLCEKLGPAADPAMTLELARVTARLGDKDKAELLLKDVVRNNHDDNELIQAATDTCREAGLSDDAAHMVGAVRREVVEMNNRGVELIRQQRYGDAIALFRKAAAAMPNNRAINMNAAKSLVIQMEREGGNSDGLGQARRYIDRARRLAPNDRSINDVLRRLHRLMNQ
jgi:CheY-like chemotaxis protein/Tfp pilus assembly protein PilF